MKLYLRIALALAALAHLSHASCAETSYAEKARLASDWLKGQQNGDGSWGVPDSDPYVQTSEAVLALAALNRRTKEYYSGITWLENHAPINTDHRARRILALASNDGNVAAEREYLQGTKDNAGGWGLSPIYRGSALDTALALQASDQASYDANSAIAYLCGLQFTDNGWAIGQESQSDLVTTAQVLLALIPRRTVGCLSGTAVIPAALTMLDNALFPNGLLESSAPTVAKALGALVYLRNDPASSKAKDILNNLVAVQGISYAVDKKDIYATALAVRALAAGMERGLADQQRVDIPDPELKAAINQTLGRNALDDLNRGELAQLTSLNIVGRGVTNLTGLEYAANLNYLDARYNAISNFGPVSKVANLYRDAGSITMVWNVWTGWNLLGNGSDTDLNVAALFGDATRVISVWKWQAAADKYAFYSPSHADGGKAYATSKGYDHLDSIRKGEGFWVAATMPFSAQAGVAAPLSSGNFRIGQPNALKAPGWNMVAIGDNLTPSGFNKTLGPRPDNLVSLWTWDSLGGRWYFYAPSLERDGSLTAYNQAKGYLSFDSAYTLSWTTGIWTNAARPISLAPILNLLLED